MSECSGSGGSVYTYEGPQFGPQLVEEPCPRCGGWHLSPEERASEARHQEWLANPGPIRRLWRRMTRTT